MRPPLYIDIYMFTYTQRLIFLSDFGTFCYIGIVTLDFLSVENNYDHVWILGSKNVKQGSSVTVPAGTPRGAPQGNRQGNIIAL